MSEVAQVTHSSPDGHIPQLRFPQFSHDWAISTIGNLAKIDTGNRDTQDRVNSGKYPFYVRSNTVERINEYAFDGEAILTSGDGVGVGKNFHYVVGKFNYHQRVYSIHNFTNSTNGKFIYYYFADKFYRRVSRLSAKNSVDSVRMSMISDMPISIPAKPEQQKIAAFLTAVDNKIEQLSKKQELLGEYKKGLTQQIFSQAIRFKAGDGSDFPDWEEKKLGNISNVSKLAGYEFTKYIKYQDTGSIIALRGLNIKKNKLDLSVVKFIDNSDFSRLNRSKLFIDDLMFTYIGTIGEVALIDEDDKYYLAPNVSRIRFNNEVCLPRFAIQYFNREVFKQGEIKKYVSSSSQPALTMGNVRLFILNLPTKPEQQKIANFLSSIDSKIEQVGEQLDKSKQFKKALLQKMFV